MPTITDTQSIFSVVIGVINMLFGILMIFAEGPFSKQNFYVDEQSSDAASANSLIIKTQLGPVSFAARLRPAGGAPPAV